MGKGLLAGPAASAARREAVPCAHHAPMARPGWRRCRPRASVGRCLVSAATTAPHGSEGFVYVATGSGYLEEARRSAESLRRCNPGCRICLITDDAGAE